MISGSSDEFALKPVVESILFANPEPVAAKAIAASINEAADFYVVSADEVDQAIIELNYEYDERMRAFRIEKTGGGYTFTTRQQYHPWLKHIQHRNAYRKVSQSALEALAIIAYRQPITKPEVDHIRGVDSGYIVRQLLQKNLIEVFGRSDGPGRPLLYKVTEDFLHHFGINSINDLPRPREIEDILQDDDMAEHRQIMMELKAELADTNPAVEIPVGTNGNGNGHHTNGNGSNGHSNGSSPFLNGNGTGLNFGDIEIDPSVN